MATNNRNRGKITQFLTGFQGVAPGQKASINIPVNMRVHRILLFCTALNYSAATTVSLPASAGAGTGASLTPVIFNGGLQSVTITAAGTGYTNGTYAAVITDYTGQGAAATVTIAGGIVTAVVVTVPGTASPIDATQFFTSFYQQVNGINVRDASPDSMMRIIQASGYDVPLGLMPIYYTNPTRNMIIDPKVTSWDLFGQSTYQFQMGIASNIQQPSLSGIIEFDYQRNVVADDKGALNYFLQPVAQHEFNMPLATGRNDITILPYNFPIARIWMLGTTTIGSLTQVEVYADNNKVMEATQQQLACQYLDYGFRFNAIAGSNFPGANPFNGSVVPQYPDFVSNAFPSLNATIPATTTSTVANIQRNFSVPRFFDSTFISDEDQRVENALVCENSLLLRVYSNVPQNLRVVMETLPAAYR